MRKCGDIIWSLSTVYTLKFLGNVFWQNVITYLGQL